MSGAAEGVYGAPHPDLAEVAAGAAQFSPLVVGAQPLEDAPAASLARLVIAAPPAVLERRYVLAQALRVLAPGAELVAMAAKDRGGARVRGELEAFGCDVAERSGRHQRICVTRRPAAPVGIETAITEGGPRIVPQLGLWSQPWVFSWDRLDPGSAQMIPIAGDFSGRGADLGCGIGVLSVATLASPNVTALTSIDIDRRAVLAAQHNLNDPRVRVIQHDLRAAPPPGLEGLDFVVMNPPFHDSGIEDHGLGFAFIAAARRALRKGGGLWMVANRHLPYEARLAELFRVVIPREDQGGFKVIEARV